DAFQHRYVKPSLSILLIDINRPLHLDSLLPAGRLREPARNANRADIVIITKCDESTTVHEGKFYTTLNYGRLTPLLPCPAAVKIEDLEMISREDFAILLITGIANPSLLIKYLNQFTGNLQTLTYPDHHRFTKRDFLQMERRFGAIRHKGIVVTTEKDAARLINHPQLPAWLAQYIYVLPVEVKFLSEEQEQLFIYKIEQHVRQNQGNGILAAPSNPRRD
ncbi:MAG: tetraacyldisaccharide 4'-kinase, partial [Dysgonamonadaceae bacterium]|nr:tetraacyldisaccharide 4'-kinase [Dysgonamonadaceae bacterium]